MLKKKALLLLIGCMAVGTFAGCGSKNEEVPADAVIEDESTVVNPVTEMDISDKIAEWGVSFNVPEGATDVREYLVQGDDEILERQFTLNGFDYTARVAQTGGNEDISGMFYEWSDCDVADVNGCAGSILHYVGEAKGEMADVCLWFDANRGATYSISVLAEDLKNVDIEAMAKAVYGNPDESADASEVKSVEGKLSDKKDMTFTVEDKDGAAYGFGFDKKPEGYDKLKDGDTVIVEYTGTVSEIDAFEGKIISITKK